MTKAKVTIIDQSNNKRVTAILPTDIPVTRLLPHVVKALGLPEQGAGSAPIRYDLSHETNEGLVRLDENQTPVEAGVQDGSILRITPEMRAGASASPMRYFRLCLTDLEGEELFATDFLVDQFESFMRQLAVGLVQRGVFHPRELYAARIIPRGDGNPAYDRPTILKSKDIIDDGVGFLDVFFEKTAPPISPVTYVTAQIHSKTSDTAYRFDMPLDSLLGNLLTGAAQVLLDADTLKNGEHFRCAISAHAQGRPRLDPVAIVHAPSVAAYQPFTEQDVGEIKVPAEDTPQAGSDDIVIKIESSEELVKPKSKSMRAYTDKEAIGKVVEQDIPIFVKRSAMEHATKSAKISADVREEIGGFLVGEVFHDPDHNRLFVEISEVIESSEAKGTAVSLDFNYSAWRQVLDRIDQNFKDKSLVGWYHTHLISQAVVLPVEGTQAEYIAAYTPFFSPPDLFIHRNFFPNLWHVALVMDLRCKREVFFAWQMGDIKPTHGFYLYGE